MWEGHKTLKNLPHFWNYLITSKQSGIFFLLPSQNIWFWTSKIIYFQSFDQDLKKFDFFHLIAFTNFKIRIIFTEKKIVIFEEPNFFLERYIMRRYYYQIIFSPQLISFGGFSTSWVYNTYLELRGLTKPFPFLIVKILILS